MKKSFGVTIFAILLVCAFISFASAVDLTIKKVDRGSVVISELTNPAIFDFMITNNGAGDQFQIYSLVGVSMGPKGYFSIPSGDSNLTVYAYPNNEIRSREGFYNFEYQMKASSGDIYKDNLLIKIVSLSNVLDIKVEPFTPDDKVAKITVKNKENTNIESATLHFSSLFFSGDEVISLKPYEETTFEFPLNSQIGGINAGNYIMKTELKLDDKKKTIETQIQYLERQRIAVDETNHGWFIHTTTIKKTNTGNVPASANIEIKKDIISRLFTVNTPEALSTREGFTIAYEWEKQLSPGESFQVTTQTNYVFPLLLLILIIAAGILAKVYSQNSIILNKKVSLVKTRGGEFALKVTIHAKARKFVTNVQITDTLPGMAKMYEKFGKQPDRIDNNGRRLTWNVERLNAGEERIYSYILYSTLKVVGRFELPAAIAVFEKDGKINEVWSNRTFFATESAMTKQM